MAIELTSTNKALSKQIAIHPQAILKVEGISTIFGAQPVLEFARWDKGIHWDDGETFWDGLTPIADSETVIDLSSGTTNNITQQILPDKGGSSSVSTVNVQLIDLDNRIAPIFSLDNIDEILGKKADFYIGFKEAPFPESAIPVFRGVIVDFYTEDGIIMVSIAHPETLKRQSIYQLYQSELSSELRYQKKVIQDISFQQRYTTGNTISIEYIAGGVLAANFDKTLNKVIVTGMSGRTADDIEDVLANTQETLNVVIVDVVGTGATVQTPFSATALEIDTTMTVLDTTNLLESRDVSTTYLNIDEEIVEVISIDSDTQLTISRAAKATVPATHDPEDEVVSNYGLVGEPIDLALKIMLSDGENAWFNSDDLPKSVNFINILESRANSLIFDYFDIEELTGLTKGDSVRLTGVNAGTYTIAKIGTLDDGSYIDLDATLTDESEFSGSFEYRSQYNVLPDGLGMLPNNVDIESHTDITAQFPAIFVDYDFLLRDTIDDVKEFIDKEIYFPQGLYTINRKARSSVKLVVPPFSSDIVPTIDVNTITNITKVRQRRSIHKYLYNVIRYDYGRDVLEDKFLTRDLIFANDSIERIRGGRKQLKIESRGLASNSPTAEVVQQVSQRLIDRYKFAPTYFEKVEVRYADGFNLEVGDILPFGGTNTQIVDIETGKRGVEAELFEVINKSLNIKTGNIALTLLSTAFSIDSRSAVVSLSAYCGNNSTSSRIELVPAVVTGEYDGEYEKWQEFEGLNVRIYKKDYTVDETVKMVGVDPSNDNFLLLETPLSFTPDDDYIIGIPEYENTSQEINSQYKLMFAHYGATAIVTSVVDGTTFDVDDASKLLLESKLFISSPDYSDDSFGEDYEIIDITGNTITLDTPLPFTPSSGYNVFRSDFLDTGEFYGLI